MNSTITRVCYIVIFLHSEFCGKENRDLEIEEEEIPQGDCFDFMLEAAPEPEAEGAAETDGKDAKKVSSGYTIYCIDISSSMAMSCAMPEIQGEFIGLFQYLMKFKVAPIRHCFVCISFFFLLLFFFWGGGGRGGLI